MVTLLLVMLFSWQLGRAPLAGTEGHRALTADQMVKNGDWLVPHLWDNVYLRKPPLQYWLIGSLQQLTGQSGTWIWRLPAVLASSLLGGVLVRLATRHASVAAGWCTGLAYASLIPLWLQNRSADIDAANTAAAVIGALALIQLHDRPIKSKRLLSLMAMATLGTAATLMLKAHAAMPVILAAWLAPWLADRQRARKPWDWRLCSPILLGTIPLLIWGALVYQQFEHQPHLADTRGLAEMSSNITGHIKDYLAALLLPVHLLLYALPVSLALLFGERQTSTQDNTHQATTMLHRYLPATILLATLIYMLAATHKPRYAFPVLPLLAPLAGIMLAQWLTGTTTERRQQVITKAVGIVLWLWVILHLVVSVLLMRERHPSIILISSMALCIVAAMGCELNLRKAQRARSLILLAVVLVSLIVPIAIGRDLDQQRGGYVAATQLIELTNNTPGQIILARKVAFDQPELFYYAGHPTSALPQDVETLIRQYPQCTLVLHPSEYDAMHKQLMPWITREAQLTMHERNTLWVVWIDGKHQP